MITGLLHTFFFLNCTYIFFSQKCILSFTNSISVFQEGLHAAVQWGLQVQTATKQFVILFAKMGGPALSLPEISPVAIVSLNILVTDANIVSIINIRQQT